MKYSSSAILCAALIAVWIGVAQGQSCTPSTCPRGALIYQYFTTPNCTGESTLASHFNISSECQNWPGETDLPRSVRQTCSSAGARTTAYSGSTNCSHPEFTLVYPVGRCTNDNSGSSLVIWCDIADVSTPRPALGPVANGTVIPEFLDGSRYTTCDSTTGCGKKYPTTYRYNGNNCDGTPSSARVAGDIPGWVGTDVCYLSNSSSNVKVTCDGDNIVQTSYSKGCNAGAEVVTMIMPNGGCYQSAPNQWSKSVCASDAAPSFNKSLGVLFFASFCLLAALLL